MKLFDHPLWPVLVTHLYIRRGHDGVNGPRHRIEVGKQAPLSVFDMQVECAACGVPMRPVREDARGAWTFNVSCPLAVNVNCARMPKSTALAAQIREAMMKAPAPAYSLFASRPPEEPTR